jgi:hypothetical protein
MRTGIEQAVGEPAVTGILRTGCQPVLFARKAKSPSRLQGE